MDRIRTAVKDLEDKVIAYRSGFSKYPESGWTEFRTASKIIEKLKELGFTVKIGAGS